MLSIPWQAWLAMVIVGLVGIYALGIASAYWWQGARRVDTWELRPTRDWDEARWREGTAVDGQFRGVRWLPTESREDD